ncbi:hypothetical protein EMPS_00065 [Entomortierella parvispora]|uniref:Uncharacterized protein n=1 Tax=Entomortierella parvispora TaxID=205924 RepID=A0A9P3LQU6_9FUNG|nr:hypothetical protein EMPS_00065 [Entomortierella parvispora]
MTKRKNPRKTTSSSSQHHRMRELVFFFQDPVNVSALKNRFRPPILLAAETTVEETPPPGASEAQQSLPYRGFAHPTLPDDVRQRMFVASLYMKDFLQRIINTREDLYRVSITQNNHDIKALCLQLGRIEDDLQGVTTRSFISLYDRIIEKRRGLEALLKTGKAESFRSTHFSDLAEEILRMKEKLQEAKEENEAKLRGSTVEGANKRARLQNESRNGKQSALNNSGSSQQQQYDTRSTRAPEKLAASPSSAPTLQIPAFSTRMKMSAARSSNLLSPPPSGPATPQSYTKSRGSRARSFNPPRDTSGTDSDDDFSSSRRIVTTLGKRKFGGDNGPVAEASMKEMGEWVMDLVKHQQRQEDLIDRQQQEIKKLQKSVEALRDSSFEQDMSVDHRFNDMEASVLQTTFRINALDKWITYIRNKLSC